MSAPPAADPTPPALNLDALYAAAQAAGFDVAGVAPVEPQGAGWFAPHAARLEAWLAAGFDADMHYIRERVAERVVPEALLPGVRSAVALWMSHRTPTPPAPAERAARVAAYAWGRDYHNVARKAARRLRRWVSAELPGVGSYLSIDTGPVLERAYLARAGVGWIGRSTMLIHPRLGTFGSLAVLFLDVALPAAVAAHPDRCGTCTACVDDCPTQAIGPLGVDARRCISYWTIEHRGLIPPEVRPWLGEWVFGCDICQDVCPWNHKAPPADPAVWQPAADRAWPDLGAWITSPSDALHAQLIGSPLRRARGEGLRRNALIVAANLGQRALIPAAQAVATDDDWVLRATAIWTRRVLGDPTAVQDAARDPDPRVQAEATTPLPDRAT